VCLYLGFGVLRRSLSSLQVVAFAAADRVAAGVAATAAHTFDLKYKKKKEGKKPPRYVGYINKQREAIGSSLFEFYEAVVSWWCPKQPKRTANREHHHPQLAKTILLPFTSSGLPLP